jgi:hypothetical protein
LTEDHAIEKPLIRLGLFAATFGSERHLMARATQQLPRDRDLGDIEIVVRQGNENARD